MDLIVFLIILFICANFLEKGINKLLGVKKIKLSETEGKRADQWRRGMIVVFLLVTFFLDDFNNMDAKWIWMIYLIVLLGSESILEWKYIKNSKQYISTILLMIFGLVVIYILSIFL